VLPQRGALVVGAERPAFLEPWYDTVDELVQTAWGYVRHEDKPIGGVRLDEPVDGVGDSGRRPDEGLPAGDLDDEVPYREVAGRGLFPPLLRRGQRIAVHAHAGPASGDGVLADERIDIGEGAVWIEIGKIPVPQLLEELDSRLAADLLAPDLASPLLRLGIALGQDERGGREDDQLIMRPPITGQARLDVGEKRLPRLQGSVPAEDGVSRGGSKLRSQVVRINCSARA
jgi:hypothetical protein